MLDLFAGCGGLSHGLELAGFRVVAGNDIDPDAAETHKLNHPGARFFAGSIGDQRLREELIAFAKAQRVDVIAGGPPCQAYSVAGKRDVDDQRGHLFEDYVAIVEAVRPRLFLMENVKGLLSMKHDRADLSSAERDTLGRVKMLEREQIELRKRRKQNRNTDRIPFSAEDSKRLECLDGELIALRAQTAGLRESVAVRIVRGFNEIGYHVEYRVLNAADYGVPQRRERVIFIGSRLDVAIRFPQPTHRELSDSRSLFEAQYIPWVTTREAIGDLERAPEDPAWSHEFTKHKSDFVERLRKTPVGGSVYEGFSDAWYRQPPDEPSRTVKENHGGVFVHYAQPRVMTPRELARLQSFPDSFRFTGPKSRVLVQIGNAVPPLLGKALGEALRAMLGAAERPAERRSA